MLISLFRVLLLVIFIFIPIGLSSCAAPSPHLWIPAREPSSHYLTRLHPKVILVLGSGSARGFAHAGVLKVLEENHVPIDMIIGTSAGSIIGALYADHPSATDLEHLLLTTQRNEVIDFSLMNMSSGLISGNQLQNFLIKQMKAKSFENLSIPFLAIATDLGSGKLHVFGSGPVAPAVNASSALPPFFRPVKLYGRTYVDGGLIDPIAVNVAERFHPKLIIAVNLNSSLPKVFSSSSPSVFLRSIDIMLLQLNNYCSAHAKVIIRPQPKEVGLFDGSKRVDLIAAGEAAAKKSLPEIKQWLQH